MNANAIQIGGDHYKRHHHETWDVILDWGLGFLDGNVVKYMSRWRTKNASPQGRLADLEKARHYLDKLIEQVMGEQPTSSQPRRAWTVADVVDQKVTNGFRCLELEADAKRKEVRS